MNKHKRPNPAADLACCSRILVSFGGILVASLLGGCLYPSSDPRSQQVTGRVIDSRTHLPIKGAAIYLSEPPHHTVYSDSSGRFTLPKTRNFHLLALPPEGWWPQNKPDNASISHPDYGYFNFSPGYGEGSVDIGDILLNPKARIEIGMPLDEAERIGQRLSGRDITIKVEKMITDGADLPRGAYFEFINYDAVLMMGSKEERVVTMNYWTKEDFNNNQMPLSKSMKKISVLKFDSAVSQVSAEAVK